MFWSRLRRVLGKVLMAVCITDCCARVRGCEVMTGRLTIGIVIGTADCMTPFMNKCAKLAVPSTLWGIQIQTKEPDSSVSLMGIDKCIRGTTSSRKVVCDLLRVERITNVGVILRYRVIASLVKCTEPFLI